MKRLLLTFLSLIIVICHSTARKVHFSDAGNEWKVVVSGGGTEYYSYLHTLKYLPTDTLFNGRLYQRMSIVSQRIESNPSAYPINLSASVYGFREDTAAQKVFCVDMRDSSENVIYNAAWVVGDSLQSSPYAVAHSGLRRYYYIRSIDSTSMNGEWYKVYHLNSSSAGTNPAQSTDAYSIIEGIGSICWPAFPVSPIIDYSAGELGIQLRCFTNQAGIAAVSPEVFGGAANYRASFDNAGTCTSLGIASYNNVDELPKVVPSPADRNATVTVPETIVQGTLIVSDMTGRIVGKCSFNKVKKVPIGSYLQVPGTYFYKVADLSNGKFYAGKFTFN